MVNWSLSGVGAGTITIDGSSLSSPVTLSGNKTSRVFQVDSGVEAEIDNIDIADGQAGSDNGGGILNNGGALTIDNAAIDDNSGDDGGGIYNIGSLEVGNTTLKDNAATADGGGIDNSGDSVFAGTTTVDSRSFSGNTAAGEGSGLNDDAGGVTIQGQGWTNSETIAASDGADLNLYGNWTNTGTITVDSMSSVSLGSTIDVNPTSSAAANYVWTNSGTITIANGATVSLGGVLTTDEYDSNLHSFGVSVDLVKDTVYLSGTLDNSAADNPNSAGVLTLNSSTGPLNLGGGEIYEGTIATTGSDDLIATDTGGTLAGVTLNGTFDMTENYEVYATIVGGLVLNGVIEVGGSSDTYDSASLYFGSKDDNTPQTISGTGTIQFGDSNYYYYYGYTDYLENNSNDTLTIGPHITIQAGYSCTISGTGPIAFQGTISDSGSGKTSSSTSSSGSSSSGGGGRHAATIGAPSWTNSGVITVSNGATVDLDGNWSNSGTISVDDVSTIGLGSTIDVDPTSSAAAGYVWSNTGTIAIANGATVKLGGVFTTDAYESNFHSPGISLDLAKDTVYLSGTLDNSAADNPVSGGTLTLDSSTGPLNLSGGEIYEGTIATTGSDDLVATDRGGTLAGVTLNGNFDMTENYDVHATVEGGLILNGTIEVGGNSDTYDYATLDFGSKDDNTPQTIAGTGTIQFGENYSYSGYYTDYLENESNDTLTIGPHVTIQAGSFCTISGTGPIAFQGTIGDIGSGKTTSTSSGGSGGSPSGGQLTIGAPSWTNSGNIIVNEGATVDLYDNWSNSGTISVDDVSTIGLGSTIDVDPTSSAAAAYVWSNTGTISIANGATVYLGGILTTDDYNSNLRSFGVSVDLLEDTVYLSGTLDNTAADNPISAGTLTLDATTGPLNLGGGEIYEGTIATSGSDDLVATTYGGTLYSVTLDGTLDMTENYDVYATVEGGMVLNGVIEVGGGSGAYNYAELNFGSNDDNTPQTLSGTGTIQFGEHYYYYYGYTNYLENNSNDTLTIGPHITIQAGYSCVISGTGPIAFQGTISDSGSGNTTGTSSSGSSGSASGGQLTIGAPSWTNSGVITVSNGGTVDLDNNWSNSGTIAVDDVSTIGLGSTIAVDPTTSAAAGYVWSNTGTIDIANGATVYLGGILTTDEFDNNLASLGVSVNLTEDTVYLSGTLDNSAADNPVSAGTLTLDSSTGPLNLGGGEIYEGTVATNGSDDLVATTYGGTLDDVTLNGTFDMTEGEYVDATVVGGLVLNGTIELGGGSGSYNEADLYFGAYYESTAQTISGTGTIQFGQNYYYTDYLENDSDAALTFASGITIQGGTFSEIESYYYGPIDFQDTIDDSISGGVLTIDASGWTIAGAISASDGAAVYLDGNWTNTGTISVDDVSTIGLGSTIAVDPTSSEAASYIWTNTGTITIANGATVYLGGVLTTDEYDSNLQSLGVSVNLAKDTVDLAGTLDNSAADNSISAGTLTLDSSTGPLYLAGGEIYEGTIATTGGDDLVGTSSGGTLDGVTLDGTFDMTEGKGEYLDATVEGGLVLNGTIELGGGSESYSYADLYVGNYESTAQTISGTGTIQFGQGYYTDILENDSDSTLTIASGITLQGGYYSEIDSYDGSLINQGTIDASVSGSTFYFDGSFTNAGTVLIGSGATLDTSYYYDTTYTQSAGATTVNGTLQAGTNTIDITGGQLDGSGTVDGNVDNAAIVTPGDNAGTLTIDGNYTQTSAAHLDINLAGSSDNGQLAVTGTATLAGTLNVSLLDSFMPATNQQFVVLNFGKVSGNFATMNGINPASDGVFLYPTFTSSNLTLAAALPDLALTATQAPSTAVEGTSIPVSWTVANQGATIPAAVDWTDAVYLEREIGARRYRHPTA